MKKIMLRVTSVCMSMILAMSFLPIASAETIDSSTSNVNTVILQRDTGTETITLPANMSKAEKDRIQKNLLLYGNRQLSESEVAKINQEAAAKGGLVYGSWFGGVEKYYSMSTAESIGAVAWVAGAVTVVLSATGAITLGAGTVASALCTAAGMPSLNPPVFGSGSYMSVTMKKQYREVSYSDGTFAYYETGFFAQDLTMAGTYYGTPEAIFSGGLY